MDFDLIHDIKNNSSPGKFCQNNWNLNHLAVRIRSLRHLIVIFGNEWAGLPDDEVELLVEIVKKTIGMVWQPTRLLALSEFCKKDIDIWEQKGWIKSFLKPLEVDAAFLEYKESQNSNVYSVS